MTKEAILQQITHQQPHLIYLSGKTCTGKTTFANYLVAHGYAHIELDQIVEASIVQRFHLDPPGQAFVTAYADEGPAEYAESFIAAARNEIRNKLKSSSVVIDGAIARNRILKAIFSDELSHFCFIYFHPVHAEIYRERIRTRFIEGRGTRAAGLPKDFWDLVKQEDLDQFLQKREINEGIERSIAEYASQSMEASERRLRRFQESFPDIVVVEV